MSASTQRPGPASTPPSTKSRRLLRRGHGPDRRPAEGPARPRRDAADQCSRRGTHRRTGAIVGVRITATAGTFACAPGVASCWAPAASNGTRAGRGFSARPDAGAVSPPNNTGDGLRMAMAHGADLANMGEAWWVPIVQLPGDTFEGHPRSRSVRLERTRPRSIIVNRAGRRFVNEAGEYNSMAGPFHYLDPRDGYANDPAWIVFDSQHLKRYGFLGVDQTPQPRPGSAIGGPQRTGSQDRHRRRRAGPHDCGMERERGTGHRSRLRPRLKRLRRLLGRRKATTLAGKTLGPIDTAPFYAVPVSIGAMGTKGGPRTDRDGRVLHVSGSPIPGLFAAGNAMGGATGRHTAVPAERSARQWFSAIRAGTRPRPESPSTSDRRSQAPQPDRLCRFGLRRPPRRRRADRCR